jgi:hypothetical protein
VICLGDILYIPRGFPHEATTLLSAATTDSTASVENRNSVNSSTESSLHVTFGLESAVHSSYSVLVHHAIDVLYTLHESSNITGTCECTDHVAVQALHELANASAAAVASLRRQADMISSSSSGDVNDSSIYTNYLYCIDELIQHYSTDMAATESNVCSADTTDGTHTHVKTITTAASVNCDDIQQQQHQQQQHQCMLCQLQQLRHVQLQVFTAAVLAMQKAFNDKQVAWLSDIQRNLQLSKQPQLVTDH